MARRTEKNSSTPTSTTALKEELIAFIMKWRLPEPVFTVMPEGSTASSSGRGRRGGHHQQQQNFLAKVQVGDKKFNSFPATGRTEEAACEIVAGKALTELKNEIALAEKIRCETDDYQAHFLVEQILDIVKDTPQGLYDTHIQNEYLKRYDNFPPDNWLDIIRSTESQMDIQQVSFNRKLTIIKLKPLPTIKYKKGWMDVKGYFDVRITRVVSPSEFWMQNLPVAGHNAFYASNSASDDFRQMMQDMAEYYSKSENLQTMTKDEMIKDRVMAGRQVEEDGTVVWHRIMIHDSNESDEITGLLVDNGSFLQFNMKDIQLLPEPLRCLPKQAQRAGLHAILPIADLWTDQDNDTFRDLVLNKALVSEIMNADKNTVSVRLIDTSESTDVEEKDVDIASLLIERHVGRVDADPAA